MGESDYAGRLIHYGKKGMHWGVRRAKVDVRSHDVQRVDAARRVIRKSGTKALSNADLQAVVTRMNLEQQYSRLNPSTFSRYSKLADSIIKTVGQEKVRKVATKAVTRAVKVALL